MDELPHAPFIIEHQRLLENPSDFVPAARLVLTPALRQSGLLSLLSDRQARLLLALLTFVSANGQVQATATQVGQALGLPSPVAALWLRLFASRRFHGAHLIYAVKREEGYPYYALSRGAVLHEHTVPAVQPTTTAYRAAGRDAVIATSRAAYASPRVEVERVVMEQLGHAAEELLDTPEGAAWRGLRALHIDPEDIRALIAAYGVERVLQQLAWLPARRAKDPARYLVAAIKENYAAPVRLQDRVPQSMTPLPQEPRSFTNNHEDAPDE